MNIIVVDDEALALQSLVRVLSQIFNKEDIKEFQKSREALLYAETLKEKGEKIDYAFLDVEMRGIGGIELARCIKSSCKSTRILFVSAYNHYACEAYQLHAKGYILKPATKEAIEETLDSMEVNWRIEKEKHLEGNMPQICVHTFGNFDVFVGGELLTFERSKSKELFAYLIDRKGNGVTTAEIAAVLWEDIEQGKKVTNKVQQVIHSMVHTLKAAGIGSVLNKKWNYLAIDPNQISCDYYDFLKGDIQAINRYMGEYMSQYSWAEMTTAALEEKTKNYNHL